MRIENKCNNLINKIPGYTSQNKSKSYLLRITKMTGIKIDRSIGFIDERALTAELHMTFLYRDMTRD